MRALWAASALIAILSMARPAPAANMAWSLSLPSGNREHPNLEAHRALFERTIAIELKDEQIVGRVGEDEAALSVYIRVTYEGPNLKVEVWDRGDEAGERLISGSGGPGVVARRVALTTVELLRKLSRRRSMEQKRQVEAELFAKREEERERLVRERERPRLLSSLRAVGFPSAGAALGPELGVLVNGDAPLRFGVSLGYGAGFLDLSSSGEGEATPSFSLLSCELLLGYVVPVAARGEFSLGPYARASALHKNGPVALPSGDQDALTASGGLFLGFETSLSRSIGLFARGDAGVVLAPLALTAGQSAARLEGLSLGLSLGMTLALE